MRINIDIYSIQKNATVKEMTIAFFYSSGNES